MPAIHRGSYARQRRMHQHQHNQQHQRQLIQTDQSSITIPVPAAESCTPTVVRVRSTILSTSTILPTPTVTVQTSTQTTIVTSTNAAGSVRERTRTQRVRETVTLPAADTGADAVETIITRVVNARQTQTVCGGSTVAISPSSSSSSSALPTSSSSPSSLSITSSSDAEPRTSTSLLIVPGSLSSLPSSPSSLPPSASSSAPANSDSTTPVIIGSVAGGLAGLAVLTFAILFALRFVRRRGDKDRRGSLLGGGSWSPDHLGEKNGAASTSGVGPSTGDGFRADMDAASWRRGLGAAIIRSGSGSGSGSSEGGRPLNRNPSNGSMTSTARLVDTVRSAASGARPPHPQVHAIDYASPSHSVAPRGRSAADEYVHGHGHGGGTLPPFAVVGNGGAYAEAARVAGAGLPPSPSHRSKPQPPVFYHQQQRQPPVSPHGPFPIPPQQQRYPVQQQRPPPQNPAYQLGRSNNAKGGRRPGSSSSDGSGSASGAYGGLSRFEAPGRGMGSLRREGGRVGVVGLGQ